VDRRRREGGERHGDTERIGQLKEPGGAEERTHGGRKGVGEREGPIRRMKRRLARWKECRRTSAGGQPRARLLSRFQKTLPPCRVFALARYKRENTLSHSRRPPVAPTPLVVVVVVVVVVVGRSFPVRCSPWTDTRASTRLCW